MSGWIISSLVIWSVVGLLCSPDAFSAAENNGANWKQLTFIFFFLGPLVWAFAAVICVFLSFIWLYKFLGKDNKKTKK